jgi:hypothetical protein
MSRPTHLKPELDWNMLVPGKCATFRVDETQMLALASPYGILKQVEDSHPSLKGKVFVMDLNQNGYAYLHISVERLEHFATVSPCTDFEAELKKAIAQYRIDASRTKTGGGFLPT